MTTITHIATRLKIDKSTVSRALNHRPGKMSDTTRHAILDAAREMGYAPNPAARALTSGRSGSIGFVSCHHDNALYMALFEEIAIAVDERGGNLVTCVTGPERTYRGQEHLLHAGTVDGIIAAPYDLPDLDTPDSPWMRRPIVFVLTHHADRRAPSVGFDDADGAAQVVRHLRERNHDRILWLQGLGKGGVISGVGSERAGYLRGFWRDAGGNPDTEISESHGLGSAQGGYDAVRAALARQATFTAIVAYNDQMAIGALRALRENGLRVPDDVSLIGWNDMDDTPANLHPTLTSVRTSPGALARAAVDLLYRRIEAAQAGDLTTENTCLQVPVHLVPRDSTRAR